MYSCYSLGHGITCRSFNQGSNANHYIHLQLGKQKFLTQTKSIFSNVFNTNILHFTRWSNRGLRFCRIPRDDVIRYRSRFDNTRNEEVEPFVFCFIYWNFNYIVFKITNAGYFFSFIGVLQRVWVISSRTCIQGFQNVKYLCHFNLFFSGSMTANWHGHAPI